MSTSRIARRPVAIPAGVQLKIQNETLHVKGPKGELLLPIHRFVQVNLDEKAVTVEYSSKYKNAVTGTDKKLYRSICATIRARISNLVKGVSAGYERRLALFGVGYRAQAKGKVVSLSLGFSHPTEYNLPEGVTAETPTQTEIVIKGVNKELVGQVAAQIRAIRPPEPYKGKGVRYVDETVILKETKKK